MITANADQIECSWKGTGEPVVLTLFEPDGEAVTLPLEPKQALTLAKQLSQCGVILVTNRQNILKGFGPAAVNARKSHCVHGHKFSFGNMRINRGKRHCRLCEAAASARYRTGKAK